MFSAILLACWLADWGLCGYKARALVCAPREQRLLIWPICAATFLTGTGFLSAAPAVGFPFDAMVGVNNLSALITFCCIVAMICSLRILLLLWQEPEGGKWRPMTPHLLVYGSVLVGMVACFILAPPVGEHPTQFTAYFTKVPYLVGTDLLFLITVIAGLADVAIRYWIWTRMAPPDQPWLRLGLRVTAASIIFPISFGVISLVGAVCGWMGIDLYYSTVVVAPIVAGAGVPGIVVGLSITAWGPRLDAARVHLRLQLTALRDYRRLGPLWRALRRVAPDMVHHHRHGFDRLSPSAMLFWRVIEINDWLDQLNGYRDSSDELSASAEAEQIMAALSARASGEAPHASGSDQPPCAETRLAFELERARLVEIAGFVSAQA
jgi:hypothetical protein